MDKKIDMTFSVNPKETAYFLGFFWADGTINSKKYLVIEIVKDDGEELINIFNKVADFKISYRIRPNRKPQMTFFIKDEEVCSKLFELGKYPKTIESHSKIINFIPNEYRIFFLRGLIDGDGCFYSGPANKKWKNNTVHFTIGSRYEQDWSGLIDYCMELGFSLVPIKRIAKNKKDKNSCVRSSNFASIEAFVKKLYEDDSKICLKRKFDKITYAINEHHRLKLESLSRRKKFLIKEPDGTEKIISNLRKYANENNLCYDCMSRAANKNHKYKKYIIKKLN